MTDKVQESLSFNCGYITYTKGQHITMLKAENICSIEYFPKIEKPVKFVQTDQSEKVTITMKNNETLKFNCPKEIFDEIILGVYALDTQYEKVSSTFIPLTIEFD